MSYSSLTLRIANWMRSGLRFGETKRSWTSYRHAGSPQSSDAVLLIGGLSSNAASTNRILADELSGSETLTWSRNLFGHTGRFSDFSRSRLWHWIADGIVALRKICSRHKKKNVLLVGHSTGGLVVLAILILRGLFPARLLGDNQDVQTRGVLVFPPFRLQRTLDAQLLWIVAIMYYLVCPAAFLFLAFSGPWMWPLSILAYACHVYFVPKISVPSGDERARQPNKKRRWAIVSESVFLALLCIYFVFCPPLIALYAKLFPGIWAITAFALFIVTLSVPLFLIPRGISDVTIQGSLEEPKSLRHHLGYRWLPVITAANLVLFQFILRLFLKHCQSRLLILEGGQDKVVVVDQAWIQALGSNVQHLRLADFPHSDLPRQQQIELANIIRNWHAT